MVTDDFTCARYRTGQAAGHYETYFQRANHPTQPQAFWIRYTVFSPAGQPQDAIGELWAAAFNGNTGRHVVAKAEVPIDRCAFSNERFAVRIADSELAPRNPGGPCRVACKQRLVGFALCRRCSAGF